MFGKSINFLAVFLVATGFGQEAAQDRLNASPRHHEWVEVQGQGRTLRAFLVFPEKADPVTAVVVVHENRGLTDWVRSVADQLAEKGYIAIAPDLLSNMAPGGGGTAAFADRNAARDALYTLETPRKLAELDSVANYVGKLPASNGTVAVAGFCWGGRAAFQFAAYRKDLAAAFVFYGTPVPAESMGSIDAPVFGFYGAEDGRVTQTVPETTTRMQEAGKRFEPVIYKGAGHGFMRSGEENDASAANKSARAAGWERWLGLLQKL